jgi:hypothetical protein
MQNYAAKNYETNATIFSNPASHTAYPRFISVSETAILFVLKL